MILRRAPDEPRVARRGPQRGPRWRLKRLHDNALGYKVFVTNSSGPPDARDDPRTAPGGPRWAPDDLETRPRWAQDGPEMAPEGPQMAPETFARQRPWLQSVCNQPKWPP